MGDHRASIKIQANFHGYKEECDMYINYVPNGCCNMDERVVELFDRMYTKGMDKYDSIVEKSEEKENKAEIEKLEKEELKRLKKKYN